MSPTLITIQREQGSDSWMRLTAAGQDGPNSVTFTLLDTEGALVGIARRILQVAMAGRSRPEMVDHWIDVALRRAVPDDAPSSPVAPVESAP
jgi:hypothetical protein